MRKITIMIAVLCSLAMKAHADCDLSPTTGGGPWIATIPAAIITVDANQPADTTNPIAQYDSPTQGYGQTYLHCMKGTPYGRDVYGLYGMDASTLIYKTNVDGIGVKLSWSNGANLGTIPKDATYTPTGEDKTQGDFMYPANSYFRVQFFKTTDSLTLTNADGDLVLPAGEIAYSWLKTKSPAAYTQQLNIGRILIVSTPSCTYSADQTIDFGTVTSNTLTSNGIERPLPFNINCRTDYGYYSASATLTTLTPSSDSSYIKVTDAGGKDDRMGIKIRNSKGEDMKVDGSSSEAINNKASTVPAQFNWTAILIPTGTTPPTDGDFTAKAEIVLQLR
ncbi:fimbrial protein [Siccibacter turicensis]|uniref:fimbrial protein n=1 Tax=Siccibacter turicensis TaxID=357233 RepID=UPI000464C708|nr:fimbrial protein [Siccibacter turicensis]